VDQFRGLDLDPGGEWIPGAGRRVLLTGPLFGAKLLGARKNARRAKKDNFTSETQAHSRSAPNRLSARISILLVKTLISLICHQTKREVIYFVKGATLPLKTSGRNGKGCRIPSEKNVCQFSGGKKSPEGTFSPGGGERKRRRQESQVWSPLSGSFPCLGKQRLA